MRVRECEWLLFKVVLGGVLELRVLEFSSLYKDLFGMADRKKKDRCSKGSC